MPLLSLRDKAVLHAVDRYMFLCVCPLILIAQLLLLKVYYDNAILRQRQGTIFMAIVIFEVLTNVHLLMTASTHLPTQFTTRCTTITRESCRGHSRPSA